MYFVIKLAEDICTGCRRCILACPEPNVIRLHKDIKKVEFNTEKCKGCGLCAEICEFEALELTLA